MFCFYLVFTTLTIGLIKETYMYDMGATGRNWRFLTYFSFECWRMSYFISYQNSSFWTFEGPFFLFLVSLLNCFWLMLVNISFKNTLTDRAITNLVGIDCVISNINHEHSLTINVWNGDYVSYRFSRRSIEQLQIVLNAMISILSRFGLCLS